MLFPINNLNQHHARGHKQRIFKSHSRLLIRKNSFSQRIVDHWNSLPEDVVNAHSVKSFKHSLDIFWKITQSNFKLVIMDRKLGLNVNPQRKGSKRQMPKKISTEQATGNRRRYYDNTFGIPRVMGAIKSLGCNW